jgi:hypothetical protein
MLLMSLLRMGAMAPHWLVVLILARVWAASLVAVPYVHPLAQCAELKTAVGS